MSSPPDSTTADRHAALFDAEHAHCLPGDALVRRLRDHGDTPEPLFHLEPTP